MMEEVSGRAEHVGRSEWEMFQGHCREQHARDSAALARIEGLVNSLVLRWNADEAAKMALAASQAVNAKWQHWLFTGLLMAITAAASPALATPVKHLLALIHG